MNNVIDRLLYVLTGKGELPHTPTDFPQEKIEKPAEENVNLILNSIYTFRDSGLLQLMKDGDRYYNNDNDILDRKRFYIGRRGEKVEAPLLANNKNAHPFLKKLVDQKANYLLTKPFSLEFKDGYEQYADMLNEFFDKPFRRQLKNLTKDAIKHGKAWVQVYYDDEGNLKLKKLDSKEVIPLWKDSEHTQLEAIIRHYKVINYTPSGNKKEIEKVEYWTTQGVWYYQITPDGLIKDPDMKDVNYTSGHFQVVINKVDEETGEEIQEVKETNWDKIPFICLKYNSEEIPLIKYVKPLIDDYDRRRSDSSNDIEDEPNSIKVVKNYNGTDKSEFVKNLALFQTAFVKGDGGVDVLDNTIDDSRVVNHCKQTRKDLYELGRGVDTQEESLGNSSGVALGYRFMDLDLDCTDIGTEVAVYLEQVAWFVLVDNIGKGADLEQVDSIDFDVEFNMDTLMSESDVINDCKNSVDIVSTETILQNHPWVDDVKSEMEKLQKQREEADKREQELFSSNTDPNNNFGTNKPNGDDKKDDKNNQPKNKGDE